MPNILEICNAPNEIHIHGASQFTNYLHYFGTMTPKVHFVDVYVQYDQFFFNLGEHFIIHCAHVMSQPRPFYIKRFPFFTIEHAYGNYLHRL